MRLKRISNKHERWAITDKMFFSLFLTGAIIEFSQVGAGFIDGLIISRFLGANAIAAEGIAHPIFSILGIISGLLAVGMQVKCAQAIGRGNRDEYCRFFSATLFVGTVVSIIATVLLIIFAKPLAAFFGASGNATDLVVPASNYMIGVVIGAPALIMTAIIAPGLQLDTGRKNVQTGAVIGAIANIFLDIIAVKMGWGLFGIGIATAVSTYINLGYQCLFFLKRDRVLHLIKPELSVNEFISMLTNGGEKAIKRLANTLRPIVLNTIIISYGGTAAMSALSIRNNFSDFAEILGAGIASSVALLVGVYYGEINEEGIEAVNRCEHKLIFLFSGSIFVLMFVFSKQIARLYVPSDGEIYNMAVFAIRMLAIQNPLQALIASRIKYLQAIYRKRNMNLLIIAAQLVFIVLSAIVLGNLFGTYGILACYTVSDALSLFAIYIYYAVKSRNTIPNRNNFLNLPDYFYLNPGDVISLDIRGEEDVSLVSEQIMMFCKGHKINRKISYFASLAFEELASNIVKYGFPNNKLSKPMIDMRAVITDNTFVIRLRDNCPEYDVTKQIASVNENRDDLTHNIGTRIVSKIASEIIYLHTFDTNSVIIRFNLD